MGRASSRRPLPFLPSNFLSASLPPVPKPSFAMFFLSEALKIRNALSFYLFVFTDASKIQQISGIKVHGYLIDAYLSMQFLSFLKLALIVASWLLFLNII